MSDCPFVIPIDARWAYAAISLMGHERMVGKVYTCPSGGFYVQPWGGDEFDADVVYLGPCAIFTMHDITEAQAVATARALPASAAARVSGWVVATEPPLRSAPRAAYEAPLITPALVGRSVQVRGGGQDEWHRVDAIGSECVYLSSALGKIDRATWRHVVVADRDDEEIPF